MMNRRRVLPYGVLLVGLLAASAQAQPSVPALTGRVVDEAGVLAPTTEQTLTALLKAHEDSTTNQVAVLTVPSLGGEAVEPYTLRVAETWGLGQADRDNGVLLLVAVEDRELRIEVGYGLEGVLPDAVASRIIRNEIVPHFRDGDFDDGVLAGVTVLLDHLSDPEASTYSSYHAADSKPGTTDWEMVWMAVIFLLFMPFVGSAYGIVAKTDGARAATFVLLVLAVLTGGVFLTGEGWPALDYGFAVFGGGVLVAVLYTAIYWTLALRLKKRPKVRKRWRDRLDRLADGRFVYSLMRTVGLSVPDDPEPGAWRWGRRLMVLVLYVAIGWGIVRYGDAGYAIFFYHNLFWLIIIYRGTLHPGTFASGSSGGSYSGSSYSSSSFSSSSWSGGGSSTSSGGFSGGGGSFGGGGASGSW